MSTYKKKKKKPQTTAHLPCIKSTSKISLAAFSGLMLPLALICCMLKTSKDMSKGQLWLHLKKLELQANIIYPSKYSVGKCFGEHRDKAATETSDKGKSPSLHPVKESSNYIISAGIPFEAAASPDSSTEFTCYEEAICCLS